MVGATLVRRPGSWKGEAVSSGDGKGSDNPGVVAPPPLIYAAGLVVGLLVNRGYPVSFLPRALNRALGLLLVGGGLVIGASAIYTIRSAGSNENPYRPATTVVAGGPFHYTRNPMYVGFALIYAGISVRANALPPLLLLPGVLHLVDRGVVEREERYLEGKFGEEYLRYKARVRRWI